MNASRPRGMHLRLFARYLGRKGPVAPASTFVCNRPCTFRVENTGLLVWKLHQLPPDASIPA